MAKLFGNREEAAYFLGGALRRRLLTDPVVFPVQRQGAKLGCIVAERLRCECSLLMACDDEICLPSRTLHGRDVILVEDAIVTGETMEAALSYMRSQQPRHIIVASPLVSKQAVERLRSEAVDLVVLDVVKALHRVVDFYVDYPELTEHEIDACLRSVANARQSGRSVPHVL
jgi:predicted phosphoribosyltransferase